MKRAHRMLRRGYTMIEVMMALAVLAIGASGIVAMQKVTLAGITSARNIATANDIAVAWAERLRADATMWNNPITGDDLADTRWLKQVTGNNGVWIVPVSAAPQGSAWADLEGNDIYPGANGDAAYCTHIRFTRLYPSLIRAEVRVFWHRSQVTIKCDADPTVITTQYDRYGFVHVTTGILNNVFPN